MKIGIFGDSFAVPNEHVNLMPEQQDLLYFKGWSNLISQEFDVDNYARSGSSLYYSTELYKKHQADYDKNIFVISYPGRFEIPEKFGKFNTDRDRFVNNIVSVEQRIKRYQKYSTADVPNKNALIKSFQAAIDYFVYLENTEFQNHIHKLLLDDVKQHASSNTIFIPVNKITPTCNEFYMEQVLYFENDHWGIDHNKYNAHTHIDRRICHMTNENNYIFAQKIKEWIETGTFNISINDFKKPSIDDKKLYIIEE
jgi:hypothetical protein